MHSGFSALREACPMNLRISYAERPLSPDVREDIERIEEIWSWARSAYDNDGPWLAGRYSIADAFFAPSPLALRATLFRSGRTPTPT